VPRGHSIQGKYSVELFRVGGEGKGIEAILCRRDDLTTARALYRTAAFTYPQRVVLLCDKARVLARNDRPDTMTEWRGF
jgi:hypothetical protein